MLVSVSGLHSVIMNLQGRVYKRNRTTCVTSLTCGPQFDGKTTLCCYLLTEILQSEMDSILGQLVGIWCHVEISRDRGAVHTCGRKLYSAIVKYDAYLLTYLLLIHSLHGADFSLRS